MQRIRLEVRSSHLLTVFWVNAMDLENAMPSPLEKGDRGAVDKGYPGTKENDNNEKIVFR